MKCVGVYIRNVNWTTTDRVTQAVSAFWKGVLCIECKLKPLHLMHCTGTSVQSCPYHTQAYSVARFITAIYRQ